SCRSRDRGTMPPGLPCKRREARANPGTGLSATAAIVFGIASGGGGSRCSLCRIHAHLHAAAILVLEFHHAIDECEDGVVSAEANIVAGMPLRATLPHEDVAGTNCLTTVLLDAAVLRIRIAAVARRTGALLMCHGCLRLSRERCR